MVEVSPAVVVPPVDSAGDVSGCRDISCSWGVLGGVRSCVEEAIGAVAFISDFEREEER